jgi:uroporphyrinogen decarboxylase
MEPDRVPRDMTITMKPYQDLLEYLHMSDELWWDEWAHAFPKPEVLEKLDIDVMHLPFGRTADGFWDMNCREYIDEWGCKKIKVEDENGGFLFQMVDHPLSGAESIEDIERYDWPGLDEPRLENFERYVRQLYNETDFALTMTFGGNVFERSHYLRGMENFFVDLLIEPEKAAAVMDKVLEINLHRNEQILKAVGKHLTYFRFQGEDLGSQDGPLIALTTFRDVVKPRLQTEWQTAKKEFLKQNPSGKICIHSCGAVYDFIPDFIEMGADILNPLQPNAKGMDTARIKKEFGERLCFHGGIDSQGPIAKGSVRDVVEEVKLRLENLMEGGGYILSPSHNFQSDTTPEKIAALYEAAGEFGRYGMK